MPRLFTITGNLLAETTALFDMPPHGCTARAVGTSKFQVGGKGVNVARTAKSLGMESVAAVFPAGFNGARCLETLARENLQTLVSPIRGETREGLVCVDVRTKTQTTYLGSDIPVPEEAVKSAIEKIKKAASRGDMLAFCGSFPGWKSGYAADICAFCKEKRLSLFVDTYGAPLSDFSAFDCRVLKCNRAELFGLLKICDDDTDKSFAGAFETARRKIFPKAELFAVTDGARPLLAAHGDTVEKIEPPKIEREISATGCGDAMLACLIYEIEIKSSPAILALKRAAKYASMCAESETTGVLTKERAAIALQ